MPKRHIQSATRGTNPMKGKTQEDFNGVSGATEEHAIAIAKGEPVKGLNPAAERELRSSLTVGQKKQLRQLSV